MSPRRYCSSRLLLYRAIWTSCCSSSSRLNQLPDIYFKNNRSTLKVRIFGGLRRPLSPLTHFALRTLSGWLGNICGGVVDPVSRDMLVLYGGTTIVEGGILRALCRISRSDFLLARCYVETFDRSLQHLKRDHGLIKGNLMARFIDANKAESTNLLHLAMGDTVTGLYIGETGAVKASDRDFFGYRIAADPVTDIVCILHRNLVNICYVECRMKGHRWKCK